MRDSENDNISESSRNDLLRKEKEINFLKLQLQEAKELAAVKEKVLKAELKEMEKLYHELTKKLEDIQAKGFEIRVLKALNEIIATASRYINLSDILAPTLKAIIESLETLLEEVEGRKINVTGGIFMLNEEAGELFLAASCGISAKDLGCRGRVALGDCICGMAAQSGEVDVTPYCLADPRHTIKTLPPQKEDHAHINIPLKSGDKVLGLVFLYFSPPGYQPQPSDTVIFTSIGNYIGLHIEKAQLYERVQALAVHDGLTGLYNHQEFQRLLGLEVDRAKRYSKEFSLIMIDIDYFKQFNDTYGHPAGDNALKDIGDIINKNFRSVDIAARYGGEEFVVVLIETPLKQAEEAAERLRSLVASHSFPMEGKAVSLTVSIGLASFPADSDTGKGLVKAADHALYDAKSSGRNRVCLFAPSQGSPDQAF